MNANEFLGQLAEALMADKAQMQPEAELSSFAGWDSMGQVAVVGLIDQSLEMTLPPGSLQKCRTVSDILQLVRGKLTE